MESKGNAKIIVLVLFVSVVVEAVPRLAHGKCSSQDKAKDKDYFFPEYI